jgi:hypothetical protein
VAGEDKTVSGMAGRYALALFELANEAGQLDQVQADLARFTAMLDGSDDLKRLVKSPVFSSEDQAKAIVAILDKAGVSGIAGNLIKVVATNRRLFAVHERGRLMDIRAAEISAILKDQIKNFGRKPKFPKSVRCCPSVTASPASTASTTSRPARWSSSPAASAAWR